MEACGFRDAISEIRSLGAEVLGASVDEVAAQKAFAEKYEVPFPLLCDPDGSLARAYGVLGRGAHASRATFLIGIDGVIRRVWPKVTPAGHPAELIRALRGS